MSLFKSLQSIPGVITIFHSPHNSKSVELLKILNKHQVSKETNSSGKSWFSKLLSLSPGNTESTTKELDDILNKGSDVSVSNDFKNALYYIDIQNKFPTIQQFKLIYDYVGEDAVNQQTYEAAFPKLTRKGSDGALEYPDSKILKELALKPLTEIPEGYFKVPLVVDWLKRKIRNQKEGLADIVDVYK